MSSVAMHGYRRQAKLSWYPKATSNHQGRHRKVSAKPSLDFQRTKRALPMLVALSILVGLAAIAAPASHATTVEQVPSVTQVQPPRP